MANAFSESRLELGIDYGSIFSLKFDTIIAALGNGSEQRRIAYNQPLLSVNLAAKPIDSSELAYILNFHSTMKGSYQGFRIKDWSDFEATGQALGIATGSSQTWQLYKTYAIDSYSINRPILKPVSGTVKLYVNGTLQATGWAINTTTGIITTTGLTGTLTVDFQFDVPVRFQQDEIKFEFLAINSSNKLFQLQDVSLIEIRFTTPFEIDTIQQDLSSQLLLYYDLNTLGGPNFSTQIVTTDNAFEDRIANWNAKQGKWNVGNRTLNKAELDYFLAFFRITRGSGVGFLFKDWQDENIKRVRFDSDTLGFTFNAYRDSDDERIFQLGGMAIKELVDLPIPVCIPTVAYLESSGFSGWGNGQTFAYSYPYTTVDSVPGSNQCVSTAIGSGGSSGGPYLETTLALPTSGTVYGANLYYCIFSNSTYDPSLYPLANFDYEQATLSSFVSAYQFGPAILQNNHIFIYSGISNPKTLSGTANTGSWTSQNASGILTTDFIYIGELGNSSIPGGTLNFNADLITFGWFCSVNAGVSIGLGNYKLTLHINCP